jgi:hypothetical protein
LLALGITSWQYPLAILAGTGGLALSGGFDVS